MTDNPCASRLSLLARISAEGPIDCKEDGVIFAKVVRLTKSSTDSPDENRAERAVGKT